MLLYANAAFEVAEAFGIVDDAGSAAGDLVKDVDRETFFPFQIFP